VLIVVIHPCLHPRRSLAGAGGMGVVEAGMILG